MEEQSYRFFIGTADDLEYPEVPKRIRRESLDGEREGEGEREREGDGEERGRDREGEGVGEGEMEGEGEEETVEEAEREEGERDEERESGDIDHTDGHGTVISNQVYLCSSAKNTKSVCTCMPESV